VLVTLGSLAYVGSIAVPAARFLGGDPTGSGGEGGRARWIRLARLDELPQNEPRRLMVVGDERDAFTLVRDQTLGSVWVVREGDKVRAMSATCPHLGCAIDLGADKKTFGCPCHTSRFALTGAAEAGPSPRAMDVLETRVQDGWVEVDFRRFRQGIPERREVGG
jgi:cytochrome b6-f complex iron-sulfur subunit/menaquinol-cytochrome c reductase iron-sulfur subunit